MPEMLKKSRLDKLAAEARVNPERSRLVYDSAIPGFFARLRGGRLSFGFGYRFHGKERRMVLGEYGPDFFEASMFFRYPVSSCCSKSS